MQIWNKSKLNWTYIPVSKNVQPKKLIPKFYNYRKSSNSPSSLTFTVDWENGKVVFSRRFVWFSFKYPVF